MTPWKLPLIVAAIAVPIVFAFYLGGPGVGLAAGALVAVAIVVFAVRQRPRDPIGPLDGGADVRRILIALGDPLEDPAAVDQISRAIGKGDRAIVRLLAPARIGFLDRWASDVDAARRDAQQRLVISIASLAAAGFEAEARVGDEDVVQAVEDELGSFPASEVILVSAPADSNEVAAEAARELRSRLQVGFRWVVTGPAAR
ncbi:MAG TPA: hypothetical protein VFM51_05160 [Solirubrobacterales bacterium]|nr:hypothetical protein [Solirubrobacterales bacterium]